MYPSRISGVSALYQICIQQRYAIQAYQRTIRSFRRYGWDTESDIDRDIEDTDTKAARNALYHYCIHFVSAMYHSISQSIQRDITIDTECVQTRDTLQIHTRYAARHRRRRYEQDTSRYGMDIEAHPIHSDTNHSPQGPMSSDTARFTPIQIGAKAHALSHATHDTRDTDMVRRDMA